jgi:hypothetical protein
MVKKLKKLSKFKPASSYSPRVMGVWVGVFAIIGVGTLLLTRAATPGIAVTVDSTLPNPTNVKAYTDDQVATITWDAPSNASSKGIVGYYVTWGTQSAGKYTNARQTTYTVTQLQPLVNGTVYNIKVQSVQGSTNTVQTGHPDGPSHFAVANGKVSSGATATATGSSARVDQLRNQMTGFFDDFNTPAGVFDETKWNTAASFCVAKNKGGAFVNNQFHSHTQVTSDCDRAQVIERPRATFDITGRTEADPGVIVGDFDGVTQPRDFWYIDLVPLDSRSNNAPLDITGHASAFDDSTADPAIVRFLQTYDGERLMQNNANKSPGNPSGTASASFAWLSGPGNATPLQEVPLVSGSGRFPVANVRYHWRWEVSPTRLKAFVDGVKLIDAPMPAAFANTKKWTVHSNLFSYNTGKQFIGADPSASMLHWDNFGFNGPAPTTVVHNYQDGGTNGTTPSLGKSGSMSKTRKIKIPDSIGSPVSARLKYTLGSTANGVWGWNSTDNITINGKKFALPNPATSQKAPVVKEWFGYAYSYTNWSDSIDLSPSDLIQGDNTIGLNIPIDAINVHIELEYNKNAAPTYTQPKDIFGASTMLSLFQPVLASNDNYLFIEQDMGLPSGNLDTTTPVDPPTGGNDTTAPTVTLTAPANNTSVTAGSSFTATASATDNVGVTKVVFYVGNTASAPVTSSPFTKSISTTGLTAGTYNVTAVAYDAANNPSLTSNIRTIVIPATTGGGTGDTTVPTISMAADGVTIAPNDTSVTVRNLNAVVWRPSATDNTGTPTVTYRVNGVTVTLTGGGYTFGAQANGDFQLLVTATDAAGNTTSKSLQVRLRSPDINRNKKVDIGDIGIITKNWSSSDASTTGSDLSLNGKVDIADIGLVTKSWNQTF